MVRIAGGVLVLLLALPALAAQDKPKDQPAQQYQALVKEYNDARQAAIQAYGKAKSDAERQKVVQEVNQMPAKFAPRFLELAAKNPKDPAAIDALVWVVTNPSYGATESKEDLRAKAVDALLRDHVGSDKLGTVCQSLTFAVDKQSGAFLRAVLEKSPHKEVQGEACVALAQLLRYQADTARSLNKDPETAKRYVEFFGKKTVEELQKADLVKLEAESEKLFRRVADKHLGDLKKERLESLCQRLGFATDKGSELILRALLDKDARREVQGQACLALAQLLKKRSDELFGTDAKAADKGWKESEALFDRAVAKYADVKLPRFGTVGDKAKAELTELRSLGIGKAAPEIAGEDIDGKKFKLSDYKGKVVLLDFWGHW
jgi:hypothetical protein